jgi:hypothetical protein
MSMYQITIFNNEKEEVNPVFVRANGKILNQYKSRFSKQTDLLEKLKLLESLWKKEYKAQLIKNSEIPDIPWDSIKFDAQEDMMLFLLKMG